MNEWMNYNFIDFLTYSVYIYNVIYSSLETSLGMKNWDILIISN